MPLKHICMALLTAALLSFPAAAATSYSTAIADLPLMSGMHELPQEALSFDTPQGRIAETAAQTAAAAADVAQFYATTLPQLGWTADEALSWTRADEKLTLRLEPREGGTHVRFSLAPQQGK